MQKKSFQRRLSTLKPYKKLYTGISSLRKFYLSIENPLIQSPVFISFLGFILLTLTFIFLAGGLTEKAYQPAGSDQTASLVPYNGPVDSEDTSPIQLTLSEKVEGGKIALDDLLSARGPIGAGVPVKDREKEVFHVVRAGETLSEIAQNYRIDVEKIVLYNQLKNPHNIAYGTKLKIPSYAKESSMDSAEASKPVLTDTQLVAVNNINKYKSPLPDPTLHIMAKKQTDGTAVTAHFTIDDVQNVAYKSFSWDLGNGLRSNRREVVYTYTKPGTYTVSLHVRDTHNRDIISNDVYVNVPYPATYKDESHSFMTVNNVGDTFDLPGYIIDVLEFPEFEEIFKIQSAEFGQVYTYKAMEYGYFALTIQVEEKRKTIYLFVSPQDSVNNENADLLWYRTQAFTGTQSNCGPTTASICISWATGDYVPVINVRQFIGWTGNGGTSFRDISDSLNHFGAKARISSIRRVSDLFSIIDQDKLAIILFNTSNICRASSNPAKNFYGKHYLDESDTTGHYVVVKGYTTDGKYLIVHDPMPNDWQSNSARYGDGVSMLGRNRFYSVAEMSKAIKAMNIVEISK